jgi:uncharacterized protein YjbI with pentapeptide repeats
MADIRDASIAAFAIFLLSVAGPAAAQNPVQIARVKQGADCPHCNLFQGDFANVQLRGKTLAGARLRQSDFSAAVIKNVNLAGTDLRDLNAYGAVFTGSNLAGANLTNASFVGAYLAGVNLRGANLEGANFSGAELARAAGLTQAQVSKACGDETTTLPKGLRIKRCS